MPDGYEGDIEKPRSAQTDKPYTRNLLTGD